VAAWLIEHDGGDTTVGIGIAHMTGLVGEISVADARDLFDGLGGLLDAA
jgi:hypothetical protein